VGNYNKEFTGKYIDKNIKHGRMILWTLTIKE
jgi:hypothetical protein